MPGLGPSFTKEEFILDAWLGRRLIFNNEMAAQADAHPTKANSKAADNLGKHQGNQQFRENTKATGNPGKAES